MKTKTQTDFNNELYKGYHWFQTSFETPLQRSGDEFFDKAFSFRLLALSKNMNLLSQDESFFVTKIRLDKYRDVYMRISSEAVQIIFDRILGKNDKPFELGKITELEAKILTAFNDYIFGNIEDFLDKPSAEKPKKYDLINLTFFIKDSESLESAKFILTLPEELLSPKNIQSLEEKFLPNTFKTSLTDVNIKIGKTKFPVRDLKELEKDDIVVFEESNLQEMTAIIGDWQKEFRLTPNPAIIISVEDNNGGHKMDDNIAAVNLWDNLQVEMTAEFDKVKISLGELKNIDEGLVVDISSVYDNKISLRVDEKTIAKGELVIINDRYGVRIDKVFADICTDETILPAAQAAENALEITETAPQEVHESEGKEDEEFDYSDFELDDDDI